MNWKISILLSGSLAVTWMAGKPSLHGGYCAVLDRIGSTATVQSKTSATALEILKQVALGRTSNIPASTETQLGLRAGELKQPAFAWPGVRACALRTIGASDLPDALEFLSKLKAVDFADDRTQQIWPAALIALRTAQLNRISDPQLKMKFLERTAEEYSRGAVGAWAVNQLCDGGAVASLPLIQQSIRKRMNGQRDEDEIEYCRVRVQVVLRDTNRAKALGSVLNLNADNDRLIRWAIYQLAAMRSARADAELDRFAAEVDKLPAGSPKRLRFGIFRQEIRDIRSRAR